MVEPVEVVHLVVTPAPTVVQASVPVTLAVEYPAAGSEPSADPATDPAKAGPVAR